MCFDVYMQLLYLPDRYNRILGGIIMYQLPTL